MAPQRQSRNIAMIGASGNIGRATLDRLLFHAESNTKHNITAIVRPESTSEFPSTVNVKKISFDDTQALTEALTGQDVLVLQLGHTALKYNENLIRSAAKAGVKYVLPTEFGSDTTAPLGQKLAMLQHKRVNRDLIEELGMSWIGISTNPWLDYCLNANGLLGINVKEREATLWDGGNTTMSFSVLKQAGQVTAEVLALPDSEFARYKNGYFYTASIHTTERELLASVMRATGTTEADWTVKEGDIDEAIAKGDALEEKDPFAAMFVKFAPLHWKSGYGGDLSAKVEDLTRFGLESQDLDAITAQVLKKGGL